MDIVCNNSPLNRENRIRRVYYSCFNFTRIKVHFKRGKKVIFYDEAKRIYVLSSGISERSLTLLNFQLEIKSTLSHTPDKQEMEIQIALATFIIISLCRYRVFEKILMRAVSVHRVPFINIREF